MNNPVVTAFFDEATNTASYVLADPLSKMCAIVDPVLDYDPASGRTSSGSADDIINFIVSSGHQLEWILETHVHADHLSAATLIKERLGGKTGIGSHIIDVQNIFGPVFSAEPGFAYSSLAMSWQIGPIYLWTRAGVHRSQRLVALEHARRRQRFASHLKSHGWSIDIYCCCWFQA